MKVVFIDKKDMQLKVEYKSLKINEQKIPLRLIDTIIVSSFCSFNSRDILKITKEEISILLISARGDDVAMIYSAKSKNAELKMEQYLAQKNSLNIAKYFITQKVKRHTQHLLNHKIELNSKRVLLDIERARSTQRLLGLEGSFSSRYFRQYFKLFPKRVHLGKRSKQPPLDPANALLSYWYSLYYNIITVKLLSYGFEPSMGYLHTPFRTHNALSSDILEIFRSAINQAVVSLFKHNLLTNDDFSKKGGVYLKYEGRRKIWGEFVALVDVLKPKLDSEIANLKKMINEKI